ncbi:hypothetical protein Q5P01_020007 [Channa striata]|uniref:Uncharacterized protein n=1 Tax=Channa striata TaxID=64152 RepID=A0AA88LWU4_CHASR|nr:hypothetical protein Q5P01_020007 [Channa striata]
MDVNCDYLVYGLTHPSPHCSARRALDRVEVYKPEEYATPEMPYGEASDGCMEPGHVRGRGPRDQRSPVGRGNDDAALCERGKGRGAKGPNLPPRRRILSVLRDGRDLGVGGSEQITSPAHDCQRS